MLNTSTSNRHSKAINPRRQAGATLMEILIGLALSTIVTISMVALMSNSLGTTSRIIQMTQLTDQLRNTMSMLTRDVRRANYNPYSLFCYANSDCGVSDSTVTHSAELDVVAYSGNSCLRYYLERETPTGLPGAVGGGAFRHVVSGGVGSIEMWVGGDNQPPDANCGGNANLWIPVTDPDFVDITAFVVDDDTGSITGTLVSEASTLTQRTRQVQVRIAGRLVRDNGIEREIEDTIKVRNDFITTS